MLKHLLLVISVISAVTATAGLPQSVTPGPDTLLLTTEKSSSPYVFNDAVKAFEAVNTSGRDRMTLLVAPSVYWLDNPDDPAVRRASTGLPYAVEIKCDTLSIIGLADNPTDVVFAVNRGQTQGAIGNFTMLHFTGHSLTVENMTMGNYCNVDLDYPLDPSLNRQRRRDAIVQAQIGICTDTDRLFARNCRFISRLNLCPLVGARRSLYDNCYFECTDDALTGSAVYLGCRFTFHSGKPFYSTPSTGAIFLDCDIRSLVSGTQYLTKVPGPVTMIDTRFTADNPIQLRWTRDPSATRCYQSGVTLNGVPVTIDADRPQLSADISSSPLLRAYKITMPDGSVIYNTPNLLGGTDGWDPLGMRPVIAKAESILGASLLSLPVTMRLTPSAHMLAPQDEELTVTPVRLLWGDYPAPAQAADVSWSAPSTLTLLSAGQTLTARSANLYPREAGCIISASTAYGLLGATDVKIAPYLKDAPTFTSSPVITNVKTSLQADYRLSAGADDDSYIIWYRSTRPDHSDSTAVRHGHGLSARTYPLTPADKGCYISATISPKLSDTRAGKPVTIHFDSNVSQKMVGLLNLKENKLNTSFAEIPIRKGSAGRPGYWHFDTYKPADTSEHEWTPDPDKSWYYGQGVDAATGTGLIQASRGARLSYTPSRGDCRSMTLELIAEPAKGPGQGFGSATGQYMDICVKFDPVTLTGYALRIERTPDYDKAVTFTLVRYSDGIVTPISKPVATSCYRTPCHIKLDINDNNFVATASTEAPAVTSSNPDVKPYVMLSVPVETSRNSSLMIQHTGSTGSSATLLRNMNVSWK